MKNHKMLVVLSAICCLFMGGSNVSAQPCYEAVDVVRNFSRILTEYNKDRDKGKCSLKLDGLCHQTVRCRVENDLMQRMADRSQYLPQESGSYLFDTYVNELFKLIDNGGSVTIENIEYDTEMSQLGLVDGKADYVKYNVVLSESLSTENVYTDLAVIRNGRLTAIYQYSGARTFIRALKMLDSEANMENISHAFFFLDMSKVEAAFSLFRRIASECSGKIAKKGMELVVSMEMAGVGCRQIGRYAKELDIANYFVHYTSCLAIKKWGHDCYEMQGVKDYGYIIGPGETLATWNLIKKHPYINDKGSAYFHWIFPKYRPLSNLDLPYVKKRGIHYGFVSGNGKVIVENKYSFVYPFDNKSRLAAVRDENNKWGFINEFGDVVIPNKYDIVNDVFVDGKNFVIKSDYLILVDNKGRELRKIYGYNYLIPKLLENEIIAYNGIKQQFDVYDFYGNLLLEDCFSKANMSKKEYWRFCHYYNFEWDRTDYYLRDEVNDRRLHRIPKKISISDVSSEKAVDLGLSCLWASKDLDASACYDMGKLFLWGDYETEFTNKKRTFANGEKFKARMGKRSVPLNIAGTCWDIATQELGKDWRMPTKNDFKELIEECTWEYSILNGSKGFRVVGKNGNSIFLPIKGEFLFWPYEYQMEHSYPTVFYWSSEFGSSSRAYGLQISEIECFLRDLSLRYWNYIRPVKMR